MNEEQKQKLRKAVSQGVRNYCGHDAYNPKNFTADGHCARCEDIIEDVMYWILPVVSSNLKEYLEKAAILSETCMGDTADEIRKLGE